MNMDGTALFECVVVVFLAQLFGIEMSWAIQFSVVVMAVASIGVAGIPSASLVAIIVNFTGRWFSGGKRSVLGLELFMWSDRFLDMMRTAVNVFEDSCAAAVIGKSEGEEYYPEVLDKIIS